MFGLIRKPMPPPREIQAKTDAFQECLGTSFKQAEAQLIAASKIQGRLANQPGSATADFKAQEKSLRQLDKGALERRLRLKQRRFLWE